MLKLEKYTIGIGDRFAREGRAQLEALRRARLLGIEVFPVWNKSNREHGIIGTRPESVRAEADAAVRALDWRGAYYVDADHIGLATVDAFAASSDFFTIDVADSIGVPAAPEGIEAFVQQAGRLAGVFKLPEGGELCLDTAGIRRIAGRYLHAVQEAGRVYRRIQELKPDGQFVIEVSMDETDTPQTPEELWVILAALAVEGIPAQTIAPRFSGRFNKGVDYVGDPLVFAREFEADVGVVALAIREFGLPETLKLSVHSGSDKFSIYPHIRAVLARHHAGVHLKTAGTTWLEELIGLAEAGGEGLAMAKAIYREALVRRERISAPYASVIAIRPERLPSAEEVDGWDGRAFAAALRHVPECPTFNPDLRQLMHVGYGIAAEKGEAFLGLLDRCAGTIAPNITTNLLERHLKRVFPTTHPGV